MKKTILRLLVGSMILSFMGIGMSVRAVEGLVEDEESAGMAEVTPVADDVEPQMYGGNEREAVRVDYHTVDGVTAATIWWDGVPGSPIIVNHEVNQQQMEDLNAVRRLDEFIDESTTEVVGDEDLHELMQGSTEQENEAGELLDFYETLFGDSFESDE